MVRGIFDTVNKLRVGIYLSRIALDSYGTSRFWDVVGWWHGEVHYTIPRLEEEKRVAAELERTFIDSVLSLTVEYSPLGVVSAAAISSISLSDSNLLVSDGLFVIDPPGSSTGQWQYQNIAIRTATRPNWIRRLLIGLLTGAEWVADNKKAQVSLGSEYDRLGEFFSR